jgi:hypothetical protein
VQKRYAGLIVFVALVVLAAGGAYWLSRPGKVSAALPKAAPGLGSCWQVDKETAGRPFPWPGRAVDCGGTHTAEVFQLGQVDRELAAQVRDAGRDEARAGQALMNGQARSACVGVASTYLGADWHTARIQVVASWITPRDSGHFGCALVEVADAAGAAFKPRTGSLRGVGPTGGLKIGCVTRSVYTPCDQPHDGEYTGRYVITPPGAPFDPTGVRAAADKGCTEVGTKYVGAARTDLRSGYVGPTSANEWLGSDQTFTCFAVATGTDPLKGTLKGLGSGPLPR